MCTHSFETRENIDGIQSKSRKGTRPSKCRVCTPLSPLSFRFLFIITCYAKKVESKIKNTDELENTMQIPCSELCSSKASAF